MDNDEKNPRKWLLRVGKMRRRILLQKWKKILECRGLSPKDVYGGLLQLVSRPRVLLTSIDVSHRSRVNDVSAEQDEESPKESVECETMNVEDEESPIVSVTGRSPGKSLSPESSILPEESRVPLIDETPELLAENFGGRIDTLHAKMPRPAINVRHGPRRTKNELKDLSPAPEVIITEPNIPDDDTSARESPEEYLSKRDRLETTRPIITEDITYVDGVFFDHSRFTDLSRTFSNANRIIETKTIELSNTNQTSIDETDSEDTTDKRMRLKSRRKLCLRKKMRQLFGTVHSMSEIEEENELFEKYMPENKRKKSRLSMDSGVSFGSEAHFEGVPSSPGVDCRDERSESIDNRLETDSKEEPTSIEDENKNSQFDSQSAILSGNHKSSAELHDIGKNLDDDNNHSEVPKANARVGIPTLDKFDDLHPIRVEFDFTIGKFVPTDNLSFLSDASCGEKNENHEELAGLLEMFLKRDYEITLQGNTISIPEDSHSNAKSVNKCVDTESSVVDNDSVAVPSTSRSKCESKTDVDSNNLESSLRCNVMDQSDTEDKAVEVRSSNRKTVIITRPGSAPKDPISSNTDLSENVHTRIEKESPSVDSAPEIEDTTIKKVSTETFASSSEQSACVPDNPSIGTEIEKSPSTTENTENAPIPILPKLRVVHHSELGSRWCPTPVARSSSVITEAPASIPTISTNKPPAIDPLAGLQNYMDNMVREAGTISSIDTVFNSPVNSFVRQEQTCPPNPSFPQSTNDLRSKSSILNQLDATLCYNGNLLYAIFNHLKTMRWCLVRCPFVPGIYDAHSLKNEFRQCQSSLSQELRKLCNLVQSWDPDFIVDCLTRYFQAFSNPADRIFNRNDIYYMLNLDKLPLPNYALPAAPYYCNPPNYTPNNLHQPSTSNLQQPPSNQHQQPPVNLRQQPVHNFQQPSVNLHPVLRRKTSRAVPRQDLPGSKKPSTKSGADTINPNSLFSQEQLTLLQCQIIAYETSVQRYHVIMARLSQQRTSLQEKLKKKAITAGMDQRQRSARTINPAGNSQPSPVVINNSIDVNSTPPATINQSSTHEYRQSSTNQRIVDRSNLNSQQTPGGSRVWNKNTRLPVPVEEMNRQRQIQPQNLGLFSTTLRPKPSSCPATIQQSSTDRSTVSTERNNITGDDTQLQFRPSSTVQLTGIQQPVPSDISLTSPGVQFNQTSSPVEQIAPRQPIHSDVSTSEIPQLQIRMSPTDHLIAIQQPIQVTNDPTSANPQLRALLTSGAQGIVIGLPVFSDIPPENTHFQLVLNPTVERVGIQQPVLGNVPLQHSRNESRFSPTVQRISIQPVPSNISTEDAPHPLHPLPLSSPIQQITNKEPVAFSSIPASVKNSETRVSTIPELAVDSEPTNIEKARISTAMERLESTILEVIRKGLMDDRDKPVVDVREELTKSSCPEAEISKADCVSSFSEPSPIELTVPIDDAEASDPQIPEKLTETNNNCVSMLSINETTKMIECPMPVITIKDDDDAEAPVFNNPEVIADEVATEIVDDGKLETIPDIVEMQEENHEKAMDEESLRREADSSTDNQIDDQEAKIFSILEVKSISKDLFNNMGEIRESEPEVVENIQEQKEIEIVDVETETLPNCSLCDRPSFVVCEQCCKAFYCSSECHERHWPTHYKTCRIID